MENYKPTNEDILWAKDVYDRIIFTQVLNPLAVKQAFKKLFGYEAQNAQQAKIKVSAYFIYQYKEVVKDLIDLGVVGVDVTATASTTGSAADTSKPQSHSEEPTNSKLVSDDVETNNELVSDADVELTLLENQYKQASTANEKRSLNAKIRHLKKKLNDGNN
jgi:anti-sigma28 factor (negative regulator of flagellin synthesis)